MYTGLDKIELGFWTDIAIGNQFAADTISLYLEMNQPCWAYFDTDLFLRDLVDGKSSLCSRLLVLLFLPGFVLVFRK